MGRPSEVNTTYASRSHYLFSIRARNSFALRIVLVISLLLFFRQQHLYFIYKQSLSEKYSQTIFESSNHDHFTSFSGDLELQHDLLANKQAWKTLGTGWEGKTYKYHHSVIKTFTPGRSPFRNCLPGRQNEAWPTEIPASLAFGGSSTNNETIPGFLPVQMYFMDAGDISSPEWYLVTPLVQGNIVDLARTLHSQHPTKHFRDVDNVHRPAFNRLLRTLEFMHTRGYCHDDIKPSNIFIRDSTDWLLGDLGNVRHVSHAYHSSRLWRDNRQLPDCRANDVLRALKSYLQFVRAASHDSELFDTSFFEGREPLSRLFWWTMRDAGKMGAAELRVRSVVDGPEVGVQRYADVEVREPESSGLLETVVYSKRKRLSGAVTEALETRVSESMARIAALTWVFGVPRERCLG